MRRTDVGETEAVKARGTRDSGQGRRKVWVGEDAERGGCMGGREQDSGSGRRSSGSGRAWSERNGGRSKSKLTSRVEYWRQGGMPVSTETGVRVHPKVWCIEVEAARGGAAEILSKVGWMPHQAKGLSSVCTRSLVIGDVLAAAQAGAATKARRGLGSDSPMQGEAAWGGLHSALEPGGD